MQMKLFNEKDIPPSIINVASVPQRSPFRYPGGKTWFVPQFRSWLFQQSGRPRILLEPFAGGGIISLTAAFENLADRIVMVEKDPDVAAVWHTILRNNAEWLANQIINFDLTFDSASELIAKEPAGTKERAFQTIVRNRVLHGGILASGSGFLKNGENGKGIKSRWYPETLARRVLEIQNYAEKIQFLEEDAFDVIERYQNDSKCWMFIDPPYTVGGKKAGRRLYNYHNLDHERLFDLCKGNQGLFLMTYDNTNEIKEMAMLREFSFKEIPMKNTHHAKMTELIVGRTVDPLFI